MLVEIPVNITVVFNLKPEYVGYPKIETYIADEFSKMLAEFKTEFLEVFRNQVVNGYGVHKEYGMWVSGILDKITKNIVDHVSVDFSRMKAHINFTHDGVDSQISTNIRIIYNDDASINANIKQFNRFEKLRNREIPENDPFDAWDEDWNEYDEEEKINIRNKFMKDVEEQLRIAVQFTMNRLQWRNRQVMRGRPFDENYNPIFQGAAAYRFDPTGPEAINIESRTRRRAIQGIVRPSTGKPISRNLPQVEVNRIANFAVGPLRNIPDRARPLPEALSNATLRQDFEYRVDVAEEARAAQAARNLEAARLASAAAVPPAKKKAWWNPFGGKRRKTRKTLKKSRKTRGRRRS
jgi:hypothetical protein